ncbi:MAG: hypothetical protein H7210_06730 [Pyrinomonadaceae bacterium]|nr:hypothetical protein [Phycisphaerales bacterium]
MTALIALDPSSVQSLPGESLLLMRIMLGRKASRLVSAELDRRAMHSTCSATVVTQETPTAKPATRRRKAA